MINIDELLIFAKEQKASDIHISAAAPPKLRIHVKLVELDIEAITP